MAFFVPLFINRTVTIPILDNIMVDLNDAYQESGETVQPRVGIESYSLIK